MTSALIKAGKSWYLPCSPSALLANIRLSWKGFKEPNTLVYLISLLEMKEKKFYSIGYRSLYHKTFYDRNLWIFVIS